MDPLNVSLLLYPPTKTLISHHPFISVIRSFSIYIYIFFVTLIAQRERETGKEWDFFTSQLPTFWKDFISLLQHGVGDGCLCSCIDNWCAMKVVLKLP